MPKFSSVLLIEDNPGDALLVKEYLSERFGDVCRVRDASTLAAGLEALQEQQYDIVLLDLGLPDSVGLSAYFEIQSAAPHVPVVILTGRDDEEQALKALRMGAEDYLAKKHVDSVLLVRTMRLAVERKALTERLKASEARYRTIVETAEEGILRMDRSGAIGYANRRALTMLGHDAPAESASDEEGSTPQPLLGMRFQSQVQMVDRLKVNLLLRTQVGERQTAELALSRKDGAPCWAIAAAGGFEPEAGQPSEVVILLSDVTGRRLAEADLLRLKAELEVRVLERTADLELANKELAAFNRAVAHDLRNPLNGIIGLTNLTRRNASTRLTDQDSRQLLIVEQTAHGMNETIAALLSLASLGRQPLTIERLDLSQLVSVIAERLAAAEPARQARWDVEHGVQGYGDRALVSCVLQNLLDNAWKYSSSKTETHIEFGTRQLEDGSVAYYVRDNGVGFDPVQAQARLFMPFQRLSTGASFTGHGLGLVGAQRIILRHGGRIWAESKVGEGATFLFTLPLTQMQNEAM